MDGGREVARRRLAFTLIELLVAIAVIATLAAILFPVFAQARDRARMTACVSNLRQIGHALTIYAQDYDETFPYINFHGLVVGVTASDRGLRVYSWRNSITPYLKSIDVLACPANPFSRTVPGTPASPPGQPPKPGANAVGWELEPEQRMPVSYVLNACAITWWPADSRWVVPPPLRMPQLALPADTFMLAEHNSTALQVWPIILWADCPLLFTHSGKVGNFLFFDGHVKGKKWLATLYPVAENNWEPGPRNPSPKNLTIQGAPGCDSRLGSGSPNQMVPPGPQSKEFQSADCLAKE